MNLGFLEFSSFETLGRRWKNLNEKSVCCYEAQQNLSFNIVQKGKMNAQERICALETHEIFLRDDIFTTLDFEEALIGT